MNNIKLFPETLIAGKNWIKTLVEFHRLQHVAHGESALTQRAHRGRQGHLSEVVHIESVVTHFLDAVRNSHSAKSRNRCNNLILGSFNQVLIIGLEPLVAIGQYLQPNVQQPLILPCAEN